MATMTLRLDPEQSDLARRVKNFLHTQSCVELQRVEVEVRNDIVVLRGKLESQYARQLADNCCRRVAGVRRVLNETTVGA
jgi:osmotically-inducible protein OsmY